jgi:hypothetical protein
MRIVDTNKIQTVPKVPSPTNPCAFSQSRSHTVFRSRSSPWFRLLANPWLDNADTVCKIAFVLSCSEVPNNSTLVLWINKKGPVFQQAHRIRMRHPYYFFGGVGGLLSRPLLDEIPCLVDGQPAGLLP